MALHRAGYEFVPFTQNLLSLALRTKSGDWLVCKISTLVFL